MSTPRKKKDWPRVRKAINNGKPAWVCDGRIDGTGKRHFYATATEARSKADELRIERLNKGVEGVSFPDRLRQEALDAAAILKPLGVSIVDAARYYLEHARPAAGERKLKDLVADFLKSKKENNRREEYLRVQKCVLGKFAQTFGERLVHQIRGAEIGEWMQVAEWTPRTRLNYWRDLRNLFSFAVRHQHCATNPVITLDAPEVAEAVPGILTPEQAERLLIAADANGKILPFVALGLFAGLRTAELQRLDWSKIDFDDRDITIDADASKTKQVRYVPMSDNLIAWLLPHREKSGPIRPKAWRWHFESARTTAKITPWIDNAMRHSFGSYHFALHADAPRTAAALGHHSSTATLFKHYRKLAKKKHAEAFFSLKPSAAAEGKILRVA